MDAVFISEEILAVDILQKDLSYLGIFLSDFILSMCFHLVEKGNSASNEILTEVLDDNPNLLGADALEDLISNEGGC